MMIRTSCLVSLLTVLRGLERSRRARRRLVHRRIRRGRPRARVLADRAVAARAQRVITLTAPADLATADRARIVAQLERIAA